MTSGLRPGTMIHSAMKYAGMGRITHVKAGPVFVPPEHVDHEVFQLLVADVLGFCPIRVKPALLVYYALKNKRSIQPMRSGLKGST